MRRSFGRELKELGELRTSQLITSYGVGAIVDFRDETAILGGADDWRPKDEDDPRILRCHNLEKILGRDYFVRPKCDPKHRSAFKRSRSHDIGAYRFPKVLYCPSCTRLFHESELAGAQKGELKCLECSKHRLIPSRFVVVCRKGHIDDFPYAAWVHEGKECPKRRAGARSRLKLFNIDDRASLGSLMVSCEDCGKRRSMQQAFVPNALASVYRCAGRRPWLESDDAPCQERPELRMRTATGVYMAVNVSALNIPPWSSRIGQVLSRHLDALEGKSDEALRNYMERRILPFLPGISLAQILTSYRGLVDADALSRPSTSRELYEEEYGALCEETRDESADFCSRRMAVPEKYRPFIDDVLAIDRLTEIVAMLGFTRVQSWDGSLDSPYLAPIFTRDPGNWLPAIETRGEGIFIRLNERRVAEWEARNERVYRPMLARVEENHIRCENASPRYVLLHTLAHLLIRSLAGLCGYQMTSLKERIYATYPDGAPMAGILIYTAASDAEGSLGGLVAQAGPEHIEENFDALLSEAEWCSGDPLCLTSTGANAQGLYGLNYGACHQCALLPETSCAMRNLLLDRAALIGRADDGTVGYFEI